MMNVLVRRRLSTTAAAAAALSIGIGGAVIGAPAAHADPGSSSCPVLYALGVQGTGQSAPGTPSNIDTGMLGQLFTPLEGLSDNVKREYIPYDGSFGTLSPGGNGNTDSYMRSVTGGADKLAQRISEISKSCPNTRFALAGYSQGAHAVSVDAQRIGLGSGPVDASKVAAVALFGDPTRAPGAGPFPGTKTGTVRPAPVPDTSGSAVHALPPVDVHSDSGGGIAPQRDTATDFGSLTGRVASFCISGDLACDAPNDAPLLHAVTNIAGQETGGDQVQAISSIANALAMTSIKTATQVVNNDITGDSLSTLKLDPKESLSKRIETASDPRTPLDPTQAIQALFKVGTIGLNAAMTVVKNVVTPDNIAQIATAGMANPVAGLAVFGQKLGSAVLDLVPPATAEGDAQDVFQAFVQNISDNKGMLDAANWVKLSDTIQQHHGYANDPATADGQSATKFAADWMAAAAKDLTSSGVKASGSLPSTSTSSASSTASGDATADTPSTDPDSGGASPTPQNDTGSDGGDTGGQSSSTPDEPTPSDAPTTEGDSPGGAP